MQILEIKSYEGRNIYTHYPAVKLTLDLQELSQVWTDQLEGFTEVLLELLPGLNDHTCSRGYPGGFVERLREGTLLSHVIEHMALELQRTVGFNPLYGKTFSTKKEGVYDIVFEAGSVAVAITAAKSSVAIIERIIGDREPAIEKELEKIKDIFYKSELGPSTKSIVNECLKRNIPVMQLNEDSLLQLGYGKLQRRIQAAMSNNTSCIGVDIASHKVLTKKLIDESGLPVPNGGTAMSSQEALNIAQKIGAPVVVKPLNGNQGRGVSLNLTNEQEIIGAFALAKQYSEKVIVEKYITGSHYRLLVVGDKLVAAAQRKPAAVVGDGKLNIAQLLEDINKEENRGEEHEKPLTKINVDSVVIAVLTKQGLTLNSIPPIGQEILLRENANLSTGGTAIDVTDLVHPQIAKAAVRAARIIGLDIAGIDLVTKDIKVNLQEGGGAFIELNAAPGLRMHLFPSIGKARPVGEEIVNYLFPAGTQTRIPIIAVTGTNGKTTTSRLISHVFRSIGKVVGLASTEGVFINEEKIIDGDCTGPLSAQSVLRDPSVEVAVLETARGGIIRGGLGFDWCDTGVITNISEDHLGLDDIETIEEMAKVKGLIVESIYSQGRAILNADDPLCLSLRAHTKGKVILFSAQERNINICRHLGLGEHAVFIKNGYITVAQGQMEKKIVMLKEIPITFNAKAKHNIENCLAATAALYGQGISLENIKRGLLSFCAEDNLNPGRLDLYEVNGIKIILDYAHNYEGYKNTINFSKNLNSQRLVGVIGVPGDRRDKDILKLGELSAQFDYVYIKEDLDLRGRDRGEVARLLSKGAEIGGLRLEQQTIILNEIAATAHALSSALPGDTIIIFYEKYLPLLSILEQFMMNSECSGMMINNTLSNYPELGRISTTN